MINNDLKNRAIELIKERLADKNMKKWGNSRVRIGYTEALEVLNNGPKSYKEIKCKEVQSRAIVALAIDFLNGTESLEMLTRVPIKN